MYKNIDNFFFQKDLSNAEFLVFFRMTIGLFSLLYLISVWVDFQLLFGKYGIIPWDIHEVMIPDYIITLPKIISFFERLDITENTTIKYFLILYIISAISLTIGLLTRINAMLLLFLQVSSTNGANMYMYGIDNFLSMSIFYLIIFPAGHFKSLDNIIFLKKSNINLTPFRRLFQIHVCISYFFAGFGKSLGVNWWNGESIWKAVHLPLANETFQFDFSWLADHSYILVFTGWSVVIIETLYPLFIWINKTRQLWLILTISMHLGIAFILNLYFFSTIMIIWNLTAFYFNPQKEKL